MPAIETIKLARTIGLENVAELNKMKKLLAKVKKTGTSEPFVAEAKLSLTAEQYEALQKMYTQKFNVPANTADIVRQYSPATYAPGNTFNAKVKVQKFGKGSGKVEAEITDTAGTTEGKIKIMGNDTGVRGIMTSKTADLSSGAVDAVYLKDSPAINPFDIARSMEVSEADGITRLVIPGNVKGGVRVKADVKMKNDAIDALTAKASDGEFTSFSDLMQKAKSDLLP